MKRNTEAGITLTLTACGDWNKLPFEMRKRDSRQLKLLFGTGFLNINFNFNFNFITFNKRTVQNGRFLQVALASRGGKRPFFYQHF